MDKIKQFLLSNQDKKYRDFTLPLIPNIDEKSFIGVRLPIIKKFAKEIDAKAKEDFLNSSPHQYHEENILHAAIISNIKDYDEFINRVDAFLPYVNNWMVCDTICNKHLTKHIDKLIKEIYRWLNSNQIYKVRYAIKCLMNYFLDEDYKDEHIEHVLKVRLDDYYVKMMIAWYIATGLAKQYDSFVKIIETRKCDQFTHNKAIQKAIESYRVSDDHKNYLKTLKIK